MPHLRDEHRMIERRQVMPNSLQMLHQWGEKPAPQLIQRLYQPPGVKLLLIH